MTFEDFVFKVELLCDFVAPGEGWLHTFLLLFSLYVCRFVILDLTVNSLEEQSDRPALINTS